MTKKGTSQGKRGWASEKTQRSRQNVRDDRTVQIGAGSTTSPNDILIWGGGGVGGWWWLGVRDVSEKEAIGRKKKQGPKSAEQNPSQTLVKQQTQKKLHPVPLVRGGIVVVGGR